MRVIVCVCVSARLSSRLCLCVRVVERERVCVCARTHAKIERYCVYVFVRWTAELLLLRAHTRTHTQTHTHTYPHTHTHTHTLSLSLSLTVTRIHTRARAYTHTHTQVRTRTTPTHSRRRDEGNMGRKDHERQCSYSLQHLVQWPQPGEPSFENSAEDVGVCGIDTFSDLILAV